MRNTHWQVVVQVALWSAVLSPLSGVTAPNAALTGAKQPSPALIWDADTKAFKVKEGQTNLNFSFSVTNVSQSEVTIRKVHPSCGCTMVKLPAQPWVLGPGEHDSMTVAVDLRGKFGTLVKSILVDSTAGIKSLIIKVEIPGQPPNIAAAPMIARAQNIRVAMTDRQAVFKGDCARCHSAPGEGNTGKALYQAVCAVCHEAAHRASMVPDLHRPKAIKDAPIRDAQFWRQWITAGKEGTLMPAFGKQADSGPLSDHQIQTLVEYLDKEFPKGPVTVTSPARQ